MTHEHNLKVLRKICGVSKWSATWQRLKMRNGDMAIFAGRNPKYNGYDIIMQNDMMPSEYSMMPYKENCAATHWRLSKLYLFVNFVFFRVLQDKTT